MFVYPFQYILFGVPARYSLEDCVSGNSANTYELFVQRIYLRKVILIVGQFETYCHNDSL